MNPQYSAQYVVRCTLCKTEVAPIYCNVCHTHLCSDCVGNHFSMDSRLVDAPRLITDFPTTEYDYLYNVSCLSDEEIWTSGHNEIIKLYNLKGRLLTSLRTKSAQMPQDIAMTRSGSLVYADYLDRSINLVSGTEIQTLIKLRGWKPFGLCSTSSGDLLVIQYRDDKKQTKLVRYSDNTKKQSLQRDEQGNMLFSSDSTYTVHLSENRNLDICVADNGAGAVVVLSAAGKLRFRYTGPPSTPREPFRPDGITTDSQANILTSNFYNDRIHIIDKNGHFLRFIHNCGLQNPYGLYVDSRDNLFVAERKTGKVKKLQYYK